LAPLPAPSLVFSISKNEKETDCYRVSSTRSFVSIRGSAANPTDLEGSEPKSRFIAHKKGSHQLG
jgi:hypothetical protein